MTLPHRAPCPACAGRMGVLHCNACHRLFALCESCEAAHPDVRDPAARPGVPLPPPEHPTCPHCRATHVRPATKSDLENRDLLRILLPPT
ncbi:MAG: hypothetical protein ACK46X_07035 [Candidatus Sericytochromatia bacterium]